MIQAESKQQWAASGAEINRANMFFWNISNEYKTNQPGSLTKNSDT